MTNRTLALLSLVSLAALITGCESTPHYDRTKTVNLLPPLPKRPHDSVKLFQDKSEVTQPYEVIQLMSVQGGVGDEAAFVKAFLYHAADVGADGVILYRGNTIGGATGGAGYFGGGGGFIAPKELSQSGSYRGEAIHFK